LNKIFKPISINYNYFNNTNNSNNSHYQRSHSFSHYSSPDNHQQQSNVVYHCYQYNSQLKSNNCKKGHGPCMVPSNLQPPPPFPFPYPFPSTTTTTTTTTKPQSNEQQQYNYHYHHHHHHPIFIPTVPVDNYSSYTLNNQLSNKNEHRFEKTTPPLNKPLATSAATSSTEEAAAKTQIFGVNFNLTESTERLLSISMDTSDFQIKDNKKCNHQLVSDQDYHAFWKNLRNSSTIKSNSELITSETTRNNNSISIDHQRQELLRQLRQTLDTLKRPHSTVISNNNNTNVDKTININQKEEEIISIVNKASANRIEKGTTCLSYLNKNNDNENDNDDDDDEKALSNRYLIRYPGSSNSNISSFQSNKHITSNTSSSSSSSFLFDRNPQKMELKPIILKLQKLTKSTQPLPKFPTNFYEQS
jgi:hypothetical protein